MTQFKSFASRVTVNGETVLSVVNGLGSFKVMGTKLLEDQGIRDPKPGQWYPQQDWLNAFKAISEKLGAATLFQIGKSIPHNAQFPPSVTTVEGGLAAIDVAYHMNHRGGDIGTYAFKKLGEHSSQVVARNPYPCDFDRGVVTGTAEKFKPAGIIVHVTHDEKTCRKVGADTCTYAISW